MASRALFASVQRPSPRLIEPPWRQLLLTRWRPCLERARCEAACMGWAEVEHFDACTCCRGLQPTKEPFLGHASSANTFIKPPRKPKPPPCLKAGPYCSPLSRSCWYSCTVSRGTVAGGSGRGRRQALQFIKPESCANHVAGCCCNPGISIDAPNSTRRTRQKPHRSPLTRCASIVRSAIPLFILSMRFFSACVTGVEAVDMHVRQAPN